MALALLAGWPARSLGGSGIVVAGADWLHDAFPNTDDHTPPIVGTPQFDTTAALIKTGRNHAPLTGNENRLDILGDSLLACACGDGIRVDLVFRILPGPGNYQAASNRCYVPGGTPQGNLLRVPSNQDELVAPGDASFWGEFEANTGEFGTPGGHHGGTAWDPNTWNSARLDTAEINLFPIEARGNLPGIQPCGWMGTYHESDPKFEALGIAKHRCFLVDPTGPITIPNITCSSVPPWVSDPQTGWDGNAMTKEYTKVIPDGLLTPGSHVEYFLRRSLIATPWVFTMTPDTNRVLPQLDEIPVPTSDCTPSADNRGNRDGHRWQHFSVLPDRWKDPAFCGPGMACMLYVNFDEAAGDEYAWTRAADELGATQPNKYGAWNGWHTSNPSDDPNDPASFVATHGGQPGTTWDMYTVHGVDDPLYGYGGSFGSRLGQEFGGPWEEAVAEIGPTPNMLNRYYRLIYLTSGDHSSGIFGPIADRGQSDVRLLEDFLVGPNALGTPMVFIEGSGFVNCEWQAGETFPEHQNLLASFLGVTLRDDDYYNVAGAPSASCLAMNTPPALTPPSGGSFGIDNAPGETNDVLALSPLPGAVGASEYDPTLGLEAPYFASVLRHPAGILQWVSLVDGWDIKHLDDPLCGSFNATRYLSSVFPSVFRDCAVTSAPVSVDPPGNGSPTANAFAVEGWRGAGLAMAVSLAAADEVDVRAFDLAGRQVAEVVERWMERGTHRILWNGQQADGRRVPSGMYFFEARFRDQGFRSTRRMSLIR